MKSNYAGDGNHDEDVWILLVRQQDECWSGLQLRNKMNGRSNACVRHGSGCHRFLPNGGADGIIVARKSRKQRPPRTTEARRNAYGKSQRLQRRTTEGVTIFIGSYTPGDAHLWPLLEVPKRMAMIIMVTSSETRKSFTASLLSQFVYFVVIRVYSVDGGLPLLPCPAEMTTPNPSANLGNNRGNELLRALGS